MARWGQALEVFSLRLGAGGAPAGPQAPATSPRWSRAEAARLGIEVVNLPGYRLDLNPIERL